MNLHARIDELCKALDARHTGCEIEAVGDDIRLVRTFSYASKCDLLITDVLRALTSADWQRALSDAQAAVQARITAYEQARTLENASFPLVFGIAPSLAASIKGLQSEAAHVPFRPSPRVDGIETITPKLDGRV